MHETLDERRLASDLADLTLPVLHVASAVSDRQQYLMRPDLGRRLADGAEAALAPHAGSYDVAFVVADGLSARAVQAHAAPVLREVVPALRKDNLRIAPLVVARHGRVALGDAIATRLNAAVVVMLIGERPGLSSPDSMGAYLTWQPACGDDRRGAQLHLQHPPARRRLWRCRVQARRASDGDARTANLRRHAQGRQRPPDVAGPLKKQAGAFAPARPSKTLRVGVSASGRAASAASD